ncbi:hypothetical protein NG2371_01181 [Nocardia gamkensis]|uniref:SMP-30/Gluconolactonase/LRE-like region domain-containing protein n=2 Tax=Nocardia gamkensis TaxID=352869 RepID=A0A7X6R176_9NOCA|nr:hypothetical protein [Nocardia gamkensis]NKY24953.1 hypothetical protein [Nocardia gamkensis]NQE66733.1 hypothetical protein [Nocardia gamkensis]
MLSSTARATDDLQPAGPLKVLAHVPQPGKPEGIAVDPHDGSIWTGSNRANSEAVLWHFDRDGNLLRTYTVLDHSEASPYGVNGVTLDGSGYVYALDYSGSRAVRLDPLTGSQSLYATFPDLPECGAGRITECEPRSPGGDRPAWPNWATFDPAGNMYVSDLDQATIWKVPAGGGLAEIWYQNAQFASWYSLNGMQFDAEGRLTFVHTLSTELDNLARGAIYRLTVTPDGNPGVLTEVTTTGIAADGLAIDSVGNLYVPVTNQLPVQGGPALIADAIEIYSPAGKRLATVAPPNSQEVPVPLDAPASVAFSGNHLLITNHANNSLDPGHFAIMDLPTNKTGLPLNYPILP